MAKQLKELFYDVEELSLSIQQILYRANFEQDCDLDLVYDKNDAEQLFQADELKQILNKLEEVSRSLKYLKRPVVCEGRLHKNEQDRYEVGNMELSCGFGFEFLCQDAVHSYYDEEQDDWVSPSYWRYGTLEHNGTDYYITGTCGITLEGLTVRIRR